MGVEPSVGHPWGPAGEGGRCQSAGARFRLRVQGPGDGRAAQDEVPEHSADRKGPVWGGEPGPWAGGAAAGASPWVAGASETGG